MLKTMAKLNYTLRKVMCLGDDSTLLPQSYSATVSGGELLHYT